MLLATCLQEPGEPGLVSAAAHAALQRTSLDAEEGQLADGAAIQRLLRLPATVAQQHLGAAAMATALPSMSEDAAAVLIHAMHVAEAAAAMITTAAQLGPGPVWEELAACPGLLPATTGALSLAAAVGCAGPPPWAEPAVRQLQLCCQGALASLLDAAALLAQAAGGEEVLAACDCLPLPLAAAVAAVMRSMQEWAGLDARPLSAACCRLLSALLGQQATAAAFLQPAGVEHLLGASCKDAGAVGAILCTHLIELFVAAAADSQAAAERAGWQHVECALGSLLAFSESAKEVAVAVSLPMSLIDTCLALAAPAHVASPARSPPPAAAAPAASRATKLQQLRQRRRSGAAQPTATLAFGSRVPASAVAHPGSVMRPAELEPAEKGEQAAEESEAQLLQAGEPLALVPAMGGQVAPPSPVPPGQQRLLLCLGLLQQLAHGSRSASDGLVAAGAIDAAARLWGTGGAAAQQALLALLTSLLSNSPAARHACAATGKRVRWWVCILGLGKAGRAR